MMNDTTKYIMPLLFTDKSDKTSILTKKSVGFIGAFISDKNRPQLYNHIFLMYESNATHIPLVKSILTKNKNYYTNYSIKIDNIWFTVFVFIRPINQVKTIESIIAGERFGLQFCSKVMIQRFWEYRADSIEFNCLFNSPMANLYITPKEKLKPMIVDTIQEEDPPSITLPEQFGIDCIE